jgi:hypothetical protein
LIRLLQIQVFVTAKTDMTDWFTYLRETAKAERT